MDIFETIKQAVSTKDVVERYVGQLNKSNKVSCPLHKDKTPSLSVDMNTNRFHCFSAGCNFSGDAIDFVARLRNLEPFEAAKVIAQDFGLKINFDNEFAKTPQGQIRAYIKNCQEHIGETDYFEKRCLTPTTIKTFGLGYDPKEKAVVIPYSSSLVYYQTRKIVVTDPKFKFRKPKTKDAGPEPLWNAKVLRRTDKQPIFVVESPICAMSIAQYGGAAVALCGSGVNKLIEAFKACRPLSCLILALDNDEPGKKMTAEIEIELKKLKAKYITYNVAGNKKDPNDLLKDSADKLCHNIQEAIAHAIPLTRERTDIINAKQILALKLPPKVWLVETILPLGLGMIVAASKVGKSWMCSQLGNAVAKGKTFLEEKCNKHDVLYYALEDNDQRLQDRLRIVFRHEPPPENLYFLQECKRIDAGLIEELEGVVERMPTIKLIIFDTFQMIRGQALRTESAYSYDYRELAVLRRFAADNKVAILLIHHTRKMLDENDTFNMATGSTGILGAVDNMYFIFKKKRMSDEPSIFSQTGRDVRQAERIVALGEEDCVWRKLGTPEEEGARRRKEQFEGSPVSKTVLALLKANPSGIAKTTRELRNLCYEVCGSSFLMDEAELGREINRVEFDLLRLHNITHESKHSNKGAMHTFKPKTARNLFNYDESEP